MSSGPLHLDVQLGIHLSSICSRRRYTDDPGASEWVALGRERRTATTHSTERFTRNLDKLGRGALDVLALNGIIHDGSRIIDPYTCKRFTPADRGTPSPTTWIALTRCITCGTSTTSSRTSLIQR